MKLKPLAFALAAGILWAVCVLFVTYYPDVTGNLSFMNQQGHVMRFMMYDMYPVYDGRTLWTQLFGIVVGFVDGFVGAYIFALLYNYLVGKVKK